MSDEHKKLMNAVIALAVIHALLSAVVGGLVFAGKLNKELIIGFCVVSVVVNIIILVLANKCKNLNCNLK